MFQSWYRRHQNRAGIVVSRFEVFCGIAAGGTATLDGRAPCKLCEDVVTLLLPFDKEQPSLLRRASVMKPIKDGAAPDCCGHANPESERTREPNLLLPLRSNIQQ